MRRRRRSFLVAGGGGKGELQLTKVGEERWANGACEGAVVRLIKVSAGGQVSTS
jgi:hypothetical protein